MPAAVIYDRLRIMIWGEHGHWANKQRSHQRLRSYERRQTPVFLATSRPMPGEAAVAMI
jgi:hypothetical protein